MSPYPWGEFHTHAFHVVPFMGPIVSVMKLQGQQNSLEKQTNQPSPVMALCISSVQV